MHASVSRDELGSCLFSGVNLTTLFFIARNKLYVILSECGDMGGWVREGL